MSSRLAALALTALMALPHASIAQASAGRFASVDSLVRQEMQALRIPGVALAIVDNGKIVLRRAYGFANLETETPVDTASVFHLASITKQITAAAIMLLVEDGKVRLDDTLSAYVSGTPAAWSRITIRHLLTHTAGLEISAIPRPNGSPPLNITTPMVFEFVTQTPLRSAPGERAWYSDAGYFLLGMVIEKASGMKYREFLQQRIFNPLGMSSSSVSDRRRILRRRVATYSLINGELFNWRRDWDYELPAMAGVWSTIDDLARWDIALRGTTLLKRESLDQMWTPAKLSTGEFARVLEQNYGFGFELTNVRGRPTVGHGGASGTYILRFMDEPLTIIMLGNRDTDGGHSPAQLARAIAGAYRPAYQAPHAMQPGTDPNPNLRSAAETFLAALAATQESPVMSDAFRSWYRGAIGARAFLRARLEGLATLTYLGHDDMAGRSLWGGEPLDRLVHYRGTAKDRTIYCTVGFTRDGRVAKVDHYVR